MDILSEVESQPADPLPKPGGLSEGAFLLYTGAIWRRIEAWITYRWHSRDVQWIVEGPGEFVPRLKPATLTLAERFTDGWVECVPDTGPLGLLLPAGTYRLTYTVGTDERPPDALIVAYRRYAEYLADANGATSLTDGDYSVSRPATAGARAFQYSGAADLLRSYR